MLDVRGLTVRYGDWLAVWDVELTVGRGEVVGLIGPNGAGKTTTLDAISGFVAHGGRVAFDGVDLSDRPPHARARAGMARTWQSGELFDDLDVTGNCEVAARQGGLRRALTDVFAPRRAATATPAVVDALGEMGLVEVAGARPAEIPLGRRKLVGVARALAAGPSLLLLDEPAAGLDSAESAELGQRLRRVVDSRNLGVLLIDHDTQLVFDVCDRVVVLDFGKVIAAGTAEEIRTDPTVIEAYLGSSS